MNPDRPDPGLRPRQRDRAGLRALRRAARPTSRLLDAAARLAVGSALLSVALVLTDAPRQAGREEPREHHPPDAPTDFFYMQRVGPSGTINVAAQRAAFAQARALRETASARGTASGSAASESAAGKANAAPWIALGPTNIGGRITDIIADPANPDIAYVAAASGGVWKTTDAGASWAALFDDAGSLSIGALAMDPTDPAIVYAGTGEANPGGGSVAYGGDGVWKTTDGGATWSQSGLDATNAIGRIVIDPANPARVFVAACGTLFAPNADRGVYRSTDAGASWTHVLFVSDSTAAVDVAIDPATPSRIYAAMWERMRRPGSRRYGGTTSGLYQSTDGGDTWALLTNGLPAASTKPGRIGVAIAPASPATVYAVYADSTGFFAGFYRSTNSGASWTRQPDGILTGSSFYSSYGWWFGRLYVDPVDANKVFACGVDFFRTTNGGATWSNITSVLHADQHAMWIQPSNPSLVWQGNDGGVYRSTTGGSPWVFSTGLPITQFYTNEVHPIEPARVYGGSQDNGSVRTPSGLPNGWSMLLGGDGHYIIVDPNDTDVIYAEYQYGAFFRSTDGGGTFSGATAGIPGSDRKNWSTPVVVDPASAGKPATTLYYGTHRLFRSTNSAASWSAVSGDLSDGIPGTNGVVYATITTIAVAPTDSATIYVGTDDANVWVSTNAGGAWTKVDGALPERWVTRVAVDPVNDAVAYATLSGFREAESLPHVFRTSDWGATWADISGNLPEAPVNDLVIESTNPSVLYVATDVGVFVTQDQGASWAPLGSGLPIAVVTDLKSIGGAAPALYAATYGRSMFRCDVSAGTRVAGPAGEGAGGPSGAAAASRPLLESSAPNPMRDATRIAFSLPRDAGVRLDVMNLAGERVRTIVATSLPAGRHEAIWDGRDARGRQVASGTYVARLDAAGEVVTRKLIVAR